MAGSNGRQFVKYDFYAVDALWRRLPQEEREMNRREFCAVVDELASGIFVRSFSLVGLRGDADFLLWLESIATRGKKAQGRSCIPGMPGIS